MARRIASKRSALHEAELALKKRKGPATEADRPPLSVAPGPKVRILEGQLDLDGNIHTGDSDGRRAA
jgi:hypothetical protein